MFVGRAPLGQLPEGKHSLNQTCGPLCLIPCPGLDSVIDVDEEVAHEDHDRVPVSHIGNIVPPVAQPVIPAFLGGPLLKELLQLGGVG